MYSALSFILPFVPLAESCLLYFVLRFTVLMSLKPMSGIFFSLLYFTCSLIQIMFYSMFLKPESGLLYFVLYKSTDVASAYKVAKAIVVSINKSASYGNVNYSSYDT